MNKPKLLFIITGLGLGGAERQLCDIADRFYQRGYDVKIISLTGSIVCRPTEKNINLIQLNLSKNPLSFISAYIRTRRIIKAYEPYVVHSHMFHANIFSRLLRLTVKMRRLINSAHSKNEGGMFRMFVYRMTNFLSDITTNVSQEAVDAFITKGAFNKRNIIPVYNGIDVDKFSYNQEWRNSIRQELHIDDNTTLFLAVGRLTQAKDYPNLLKAFSLVSAESASMLAIIGAGELDNLLKNISKELQIDQRVRWLGARQDVERWYSACDLFVLSSQWEGFGLVVAEAMASEALVVVTDAGGVAELVGDSEFVVPISDSVALANKMNQIISYDKSIICDIKRNNREKIVNGFSLNSVIKKWMYLYSGKVENE